MNKLNNGITDTINSLLLACLL